MRLSFLLFFTSGGLCIGSIRGGSCRVSGRLVRRLGSISISLFICSFRLEVRRRVPRRELKI